jgi:hypothetical protein
MNLLPALAGVVVAIALAVPAHADTTAEHNYITALHEEGIGGASDAAFIQAGYTICKDFDSGAGPVTETHKVMDNFQLVYAAAGYLVGDARLNFCPS